jgi:hypothetical protein
VSMVDDFDEIVEPYHRTLGQIINGNPDGYKNIYSHRDDEAHEARCRWVGNWSMSAPISAIKTSAVLRSTPGMVSRSFTSSEKGAITRSISMLNWAMDSSR